MNNKFSYGVCWMGKGKGQRRLFYICGVSVSLAVFYVFKDNYYPQKIKKSRIQKAAVIIINQMLKYPKTDFVELCNKTFDELKLRMHFAFDPINNSVGKVKQRSDFKRKRKLNIV